MVVVIKDRLRVTQFSTPLAAIERRAAPTIRLKPRKLEPSGGPLQSETNHSLSAIEQSFSHSHSSPALVRSSTH
jgi:hypothetical protein